MPKYTYTKSGKLNKTTLSGHSRTSAQKSGDRKKRKKYYKKCGCCTFSEVKRCQNSIKNYDF